MSWIPSYKKPSGGSSYVPCNWSDGSDEEIVEALEKHYNDEIDLTEYWSVGDERVVSLSAMEATGGTTGVSESHIAQDVTLVLSQIGGKTLATPINGHTTCAFQVDQKDCLSPASGYMNFAKNNTWENSGRRNWCNSTYKNAFPSTFISIFKQFINQTCTNGTSYTIGNTTDIFALRAEIEVTGQTRYSWSGEGVQVDWYKTVLNMIKHYTYGTQAGTAVGYWLRSPAAGNASNYCYLSDGACYTYSANSTNYFIAPFGVI